MDTKEYLNAHDRPTEFNYSEARFFRQTVTRWCSGRTPGVTKWLAVWRRPSSSCPSTATSPQRPQLPILKSLTISNNDARAYLQLDDKIFKAKVKASSMSNQAVIAKLVRIATRTDNNFSIPPPAEYRAEDNQNELITSIARVLDLFPTDLCAMWTHSPSSNRPCYSPTPAFKCIPVPSQTQPAKISAFIKTTVILPILPPPEPVQTTHPAQTIIQPPVMPSIIQTTTTPSEPLSPVVSLSPPLSASSPAPAPSSTFPDVAVPCRPAASSLQALLQSKISRVPAPVSYCSCPGFRFCPCSSSCGDFFSTS